jgi:hypothetical protein
LIWMGMATLLGPSGWPIRDPKYAVTGRYFKSKGRRAAPARTNHIAFGSGRSAKE